jgi:hypothetical protein
MLAVITFATDKNFQLLGMGQRELEVYSSTQKGKPQA